MIRHRILAAIKRRPVRDFTSLHQPRYQLPAYYDLLLFPINIPSRFNSVVNNSIIDQLLVANRYFVMLKVFLLTFYSG